MKTKDDLLTIQDAAKALGVCVRTAFSYVKQGTLKSVRIGGLKKAGRVYIPKAEIERLLKSK
ncbi:MAG TPA: helix-turn-helix domain-containing protein [Candidatus Marinimicrobia bacterium]|nr:helix-turn-helix domain-containing protein [Candidatus Neomarinimicrobiota bacterium]HRS51825.1 helix-turn-helix domain-containing protein [Candidatus Neomarinimicrobiota bacterium]HRU92623.1 helix-turn-helix domain-containing protein [Candidatus Neomarinimicrobiota bacterium]